MNEEQEQEAFALISYYVILQWGRRGETWEQTRLPATLMLASMQQAWKIEASETNMRKADALLERIRQHVYEADMRHIWAFCLEDDRRRAARQA